MLPLPHRMFPGNMSRCCFDERSSVNGGGDTFLSTMSLLSLVDGGGEVHMKPDRETRSKLVMHQEVYDDLELGAAAVRACADSAIDFIG